MWKEHFLKWMEFMEGADISQICWETFEYSGSPVPPSLWIMEIPTFLFYFSLRHRFPPHRTLLSFLSTLSDSPLLNHNNSLKCIISASLGWCQEWNGRLQGKISASSFLAHFFPSEDEKFQRSAGCRICPVLARLGASVSVALNKWRTEL